MRLTGPDPDTRQPHGRRARGAGPRHPRGPCRFLHGRVRVPQDARPVVGAGPGSGRDRPRLGDGHHAGTGSPRRAPRRDVRHRQTGEGARAAGPASWDAGSRRGARTGCTWPASPACAWPTDASAARRPAADVLARGCMCVFCQVVIGQCGVSFPSEKAVGFSPVRNWPVIARVLLFHCIRA